MIRATTELRAAAERLLGLAAASRARGTARRPAAAVVSDRLRGVLSTLLGTQGYRALLARAVTLAKAEAPGLSGVAVAADGSLSGMSVNDEPVDEEVALVAHILGLLITFVGVALMLRLVSDAWPDASLDDLDFDKGQTP